MPDDPTLGEIARRFEDRFADVREDIRTIATGIDTRVSMERYQIEQQASAKEIRDILQRVRTVEEANREKERQRQADRRLIFSALVVPVLMVFLTVYLGTRGAAS